MVVELDHPRMGRILQTASPIKVGGSTIDHRPGPALGEHTNEVLRNYAGASDELVARWRRDGVI